MQALHGLPTTYHSVGSLTTVGGIASWKNLLSHNGTRVLLLEELVGFRAKAMANFCHLHWQRHFTGISVFAWAHQLAPLLCGWFPASQKHLQERATQRALWIHTKQTHAHWHNAARRVTDIWWSSDNFWRGNLPCASCRWWRVCSCWIFAFYARVGNELRHTRMQVKRISPAHYRLQTIDAIAFAYLTKFCANATPYTFS